jgi:long-chain fatty acid transport protein
LPSDPFFANSSVVGNSASISFALPLMLRAGVELRFLPGLRAELGFDYEAWSMQQSIDIRPSGIYISGAPGIGNYYLGAITLPRNMNGSFSVHLGGEWETLQRRLVLRLGYLLETSATPDQYMSVLTSDGLKNMIAMGFSLRVWRARLDVGYAHTFYTDRNVTSSMSPQLNPVQPGIAVPVGNGLYRVSNDIIAVGLETRL